MILERIILGKVYLSLLSPQKLQMEINVQSHFQNKKKQKSILRVTCMIQKGLCKRHCSTFPGELGGGRGGGGEEKTPRVKVWFARWSKEFVFQQEFKSSGSFRRPPRGSLFGFSQPRRPCNCKSNCVHRSNGVHRSKHSHTGIQTLEGATHTPESGAHLVFSTTRMHATARASFDVSAFTA